MIDNARPHRALACLQVLMSTTLNGISWERTHWGLLLVHWRTVYLFRATLPITQPIWPINACNFLCPLGLLFPINMLVGRHPVFKWKLTSPQNVSYFNRIHYSDYNKPVSARSCIVREFELSQHSKIRGEPLGTIIFVSWGGIVSGWDHVYKTKCPAVVAATFLVLFLKLIN